MLSRAVHSILAAVLVPGLSMMGMTALAATAEEIARGGYLITAGGCVSCHTAFKKKGKPFAGGEPIPTPFGTFYPPNITHDPKHGIGAWSDAQFIRAMREGKNPDGAYYFPAFPYTSYTKITAPDLKAMKAYLFSIPAVAQPSVPHDISFPFSWRFLQMGWKMLFFREGEFKPDSAASATVNRGAYLANALAHCGECHTPRNILGGIKRSHWFTGAEKGKGPEGEGVPNIRSEKGRGIHNWSTEQIVTYLESGEDPDGDYAGSLMFDVVDQGTERLSNSDRKAIATYLKDLPPLP